MSARGQEVPGREVLQAAGQAALLPWMVMAWMFGAAARTFEEATRAARSGIDTMLDDGAALPTDLEPRFTAERGDRSEEDVMSDARWNGDDDKQVRLFEYTLVTVERGSEHILEHGQKLIRDPMTEEEFANSVIAEYARRESGSLSEEAANNLRVAARHLKTWAKRPLHYQERQLEVLHEIAHSLREEE